jgi:hypothetical protein
LDSREPDLELFDIASTTNSKAKSSKNTGPTPTTGTTSLNFHDTPQSFDILAGGKTDELVYPTIRAEGHRANDNGILAVEINQRREARFSKVMGALSHGGGTQIQAILSNEQMSNGEARHAKISPSQGNAAASQEPNQDFSISGKITSRRTAQDTLRSWSRSQDYFHRIGGGILPPFLVPSQDGNLLSQERDGAILAFAGDRSGRCVGGLLTLDTLEWPKDGVECFLPQVLEKSIPPKYYGSQQYCLGILRRSARRGITFAERLRGALAIRAVTPLANNLWLALLRRQEPVPQELLDKATKLISALWPLPRRVGTQEVIQEVIQAWGLSVRRLTPTETLTLQGFPKGWCDLPIQESTTRRGMRSASKSRSGSDGNASKRLGAK